MHRNIRKSAATLAAVSAFGLGGAAIAGAAQDAGTASSSSSSSNRSAHRHDGRGPRAPLSSAVAAKVKAAALEKLPGATVLRTEAGGPYDAPYHAHVRTASGQQRVVLVNASFEATSVQAELGRRGGRHGRGGHGETALTGAKKQEVEAAVKARYAGATILRTETNRDSSAPYESHIRTKAGRELEVLVSKGFKVVGAEQHGARR